MDQLAELVVRGLIVPVQRLQPVDLVLHLAELGESLLVVRLLVGLLRLLVVDLGLRAAALRLQGESEEEVTYLRLEHVRGVAVADRDGRRAVEGLGQLRVHLDEQVPVLRHLAVASRDALGDPVNERLADDGGADVDDPVARKLANLVRLGRKVEVHRLEPRQEVKDELHRQVVVLRDWQVAHGMRRNDSNGQHGLGILTQLRALDDVFAEVDGYGVEGRQVCLAVNSQEGEDLPLVAELRGERRHVDKLGLHEEGNDIELFNVRAGRAIYEVLV